ncbi:hypothetical protein HZS_5548 [Henneguya salminicola]|nr:hypothetical protein HZS_5548 [Henneguya salminicola]
MSRSGEEINRSGFYSHAATSMGEGFAINDCQLFQKSRVVLSNEENEGKKKKKLQDEIYIPSNMISEEFESYDAVDNELPTEEEISETDIIRELEK